MKAGPLRHRVELQKPNLSQGGSGDQVTSYETAMVVWASVQPLQGRELMAADQLKYEVDTRICVRWSSVIDVVNPQWRAKHRSRIYNIQSVIEVNSDHREVQFMCNSGVREA